MLLLYWPIARVKPASGVFDRVSVLWDSCCIAASCSPYKSQCPGRRRSNAARGAVCPVSSMVSSPNFSSVHLPPLVLQEGIVPGGGAAMLHLSEFVPAFKDTLEDPEEKMGADIIGKALT